MSSDKIMKKILNKKKHLRARIIINWGKEGKISERKEKIY
jgi:hypothetical protein